MFMRGKGIDVGYADVVRHVSMRKTLDGSPHTNILTGKEVCAIFGIAYDTLIRWRRRRVGPPYYKVQRQYQYREKDVMEWLEKGKNDTSAYKPLTDYVK